MRTRMRIQAGATLLVAGWLFAAGPTLLHPAAASAGYCGSYEDSMRKLLDRVEYKARMFISNGLNWLQNLLHMGFFRAPRLALWQLHWQSREALAEGLRRNAKDLERLGDAVRPFWERSQDVRRFYNQEELDVDGSLRETMDSAMVVWSVCRAVSEARMEYCRLPGSSDRDAKRLCPSLVLRLGLLYRGRCSDGRATAEAARMLGVEPDVFRRLCRVLAEGRAEHCTSFGFMGKKIVTICQAIAGRQASACSGWPKDEKDSSGCLREFETYEVVVGRRPLGSWARSYDPFRAEMIALRSVSGQTSCMNMALKAYDEKSFSFFGLVYRSWYPLPDLR